MPTFNELPGSLGFVSEWDTWFKDGILYNTDIFGTFVSQTQTNGLTNVSTINTDGYLQLSNSSSSNGSAAVYSFNTIPQTYDAVVIKIDSLTIQQTTVGCHIGISNQKTANNAAPTKVDLALQPMTNEWFVIPLGHYKEQSNSGYLEIYGTVTLRISEIHFINIGKTHPQTVDLDGLLTQTKTVIPSGSTQTVTPDSGYVLSAVTVSPQATPADFSGTGGNSSSLSISDLEVGVWYAFACYNGRGTTNISLSSGLEEARSSGSTASVMESDGSTTTHGYVRCFVGRTSSSTVRFSGPYASNMRIRYVKIGDFGDNNEVQDALEE